MLVSYGYCTRACRTRANTLLFRPTRILFIRLARRRYSLFVVVHARIFHINCCHRCIFILSSDFLVVKLLSFVVITISKSDY